MNSKILVCYTSRAGATAGVAEKIGQVLTSAGYAVDVKSAAEAGDPSGYAGVVLGSAIRFGQWLPEAIQFIHAHKQTLADKPVCIFTVHLMNLGDDEASQRQRQDYLKAVHEELTPKAEAFFAGSNDPARLGFKERLITRMVKASQEDLRDWSQIEAWAHSLTQWFPVQTEK